MGIKAPIAYFGRDSIYDAEGTSSALWAASPEEKRLVGRPPPMLMRCGGIAASRFSRGEAARRADEVPFP